MRRRLRGKDETGCGAMVGMGVAPATASAGRWRSRRSARPAWLRMSRDHSWVGTRAVRDRTADVKVLTAPVDGTTHEYSRRLSLDRAAPDRSCTTSHEPALRPDHVVYRSRSQAAAIAACGVVVLIAAIAGLVGTWGTDRFTGMIAIAAVAALIGGFLVLRVGRTALYAGRDGVRIANVWSTHVLGPLVCHLDRVGVPELVWCEASPHSRCRCCSAELLASGGLLPVPTRSGPVNDTQQRANGSWRRMSIHDSSWDHAQRSMPTSRRRPPLPWRTSTAPRAGSRSVSARSSASPIRRPARHRITISALGARHRRCRPRRA